MMWRCRRGTAISIGSQMIELDECSAGDMIGELVEIVEVGKRAVAAVIVEVAHIGGAVHRHENDCCCRRS